jgi:hypothetical protein
MLHCEVGTLACRALGWSMGPVYRAFVQHGLREQCCTADKWQWGGFPHSSPPDATFQARGKLPTLFGLHFKYTRSVTHVFGALCQRPGAFCCAWAGQGGLAPCGHAACSSLLPWGQSVSLSHVGHAHGDLFGCLTCSLWPGACLRRTEAAGKLLFSTQANDTSLC